MDSYRDEIYSERVRCGKRTYFIDVKPTQSGTDFFITISESRKVGDKYEKHKIYLYKEDFEKFDEALTRSIDMVGKFMTEVKTNGAPIKRDDHPPDLGNLRPPQFEAAPVMDEFRDLTVDDREA